MWDDLVDILLPDDRGLVAVLRAYFDESERNSGVYCVAGYVLDKGGARDLGLRLKRLYAPWGGLHTTELNNTAGRYKGMTAGERDELVKATVGIINESIIAGAAISCWTQDVTNYSPDFIRGFSNAYSILCHLAATALGMWLRERYPSGSGGVAYVFESGNQHAGEANDLLSNGKRASHVGDAYQYRSHAFTSKEDAPQLWAADFLAWEWAKYWDETVARKVRPMRGSLRGLLVPRADDYKVAHLGGERFVTFFNQIRELGISQLQETAAEQAGIGRPDEQLVLSEKKL